MSWELRRQHLTETLRAIRHAARAAHLTDRTHHPRSRAVVTPKGTFASASLAADAFGYTRQHAAWLARTSKKGWRYTSPGAGARM